MSNSEIIFNVMPQSGVLHGYPVRIHDYSWHIAVFVVESEAQYFADYANAQFQKHDTTDMAEWDSPVHDEQPVTGERSDQ